jgi:two-component system chemotaxis sensor kinase CheA
VVQVGAEGRAALPLALVDRLEEFPRSTIEQAGGRDVVQYRDSILPLIDVCGAVGFTPNYEQASDSIQVVVFSQGGRMVGLVVERIIDIVQERATVEQHGSRYGMNGSAVLQGLVTDMLDLHQVIGAADPEFFQTVAETADAGSYSHV